MTPDPRNPPGFSGYFQITPEPTSSEKEPPESPPLGTNLMTYGGALEAVAKRINEQYHVPRVTMIRTGSCGGATTAAYDPDKHEVMLCEEFRERIRELLLKEQTVPTFFVVQPQEAKYSTLVKAKVRMTAEFADIIATRIMTFVGVHEIGHALIHELDLPITGSEEDAADEAALLFIAERRELYLWYSVLWFESQIPKDALSLITYRDKHALNGSRAATMACLLYGHSPDDEFSRLMAKDEAFSIDRESNCMSEYQQKM
jgi:hypothetical protein